MPSIWKDWEDSVEDIVGSIWGRIDMPLGESSYGRLTQPVANDMTVEVIRKFNRVMDNQDDNHSEEFVEILTDEEKSEIWSLTSFVETHYRLPGR